jgi:PKD repeat protein
MVTTASGTDTEAKAGYITVSEPPVPPVAEFSGTPTTGSIPLTVQFSDLSSPGTASITSRLWSFGDGGTSTAQNPSHTYAAAGSYTVSLTVTTSVGSDGETKTDYIVATQPPTADFSGTPRTGDQPLTVQFSDLSTAGSAPITAWSWSFGDGGTSTVQNPSHVYATADTFTVALFVSTADGTDTETKADYITVLEPPAPPVAAFSGTPTSGPAPLGVQFSDLSTPGTAPITTWSWSFGDGGTSTTQNPSHTYLLPGAYSVSLAVTTADGTDSTGMVDYITACQAPTADFSADTTDGVAPLTVQFTDLSAAGEGSITAWSWTFGDGGTSTEQNPSYSYATPGTYDVSLSVTDACGTRTATKAGFVTVQNPCNPATYSIADAFVEVRADADQDGCAERARVHFDANVDAGCSKSVFARVFFRIVGTTDWGTPLQPPCFTINGASAADETFVQVQNLALGFYEIRIELYECGGTTPVASRDYLDDTDLANQCFE